MQPHRANYGARWGCFRSIPKSSSRIDPSGKDWLARSKDSSTPNSPMLFAASSHLVLTAALAGAALTSAAAAAPQWSTDTSTNQIASDAASDQNQPKVLPARDGGYWVSWLDGIATGWDVRLQRFDFQGNAVFPAGGLLVADRSFSSTQDYGFDVSLSGDALLAFRDDRSGNVEITAARYTPDGTPVYGAAGVTLTSNVGFVASPRITRGSNFAFVAWTQNSSVRIRSIAPDGTPSTVDQVWTPSAGSYTVADMHSGGEDAIFSVVHATGGFSSPRHLFIQRIRPTGVLPWGLPLTPVYTAGSLQIGAFPKFTSDGNSLLTWYSSSPTLQCFAQFIDSNGVARWQPNGVPVATTPSVRVDPMASQNLGTFLPVVVWREQNASQSQSGIFAQRFDPQTGARLWGDAGISISPVGPQFSSSPEVFVDFPSQTATVTWKESPSFGNDRLFGTVLDSSGSVAVPTFDIASTPSGKSRVTGASDRFGGTLTAWSDNRDDGGDILIQQIADDGTPGTLGIVSTSAPLCTAVPNGIGERSVTFVVGSASAQANNNTLWTVNMPSFSFSFYFTGTSAAFVIAPGGSIGNLCVGGPIGRFVGPGQIMHSGSAGSVRLPIDLTQQPTPTGLVTVQSGQQWYYQAWFRDITPTGPASNFSEACSVTYQ